jgi:hypothetical protein
MTKLDQINRLLPLVVHCLLELKDHTVKKRTPANTLAKQGFEDCNSHSLLTTTSSTPLKEYQLDEPSKERGLYNHSPSEHSFEDTRPCYKTKRRGQNCYIESQPTISSDNTKCQDLKKINISDTPNSHRLFADTISNIVEIERDQRDLILKHYRRHHLVDDTRNQSLDQHDQETS